MPPAIIFDDGRIIRQATPPAIIFDEGQILRNYFFENRGMRAVFPGALLTRRSRTRRQHHVDLEAHDRGAGNPAWKGASPAKSAP